MLLYLTALLAAEKGDGVRGWDQSGSSSPAVSLDPAKLVPANNGRKMVAGSMQIFGLFNLLFN